MRGIVTVGVVAEATNVQRGVGDGGFVVVVWVDVEAAQLSAV
tara:strand:- start:266 stop:391 length:126 start_codon:yes stop_codon:yes gene_type:complete